jgi:hypothetical protein
MRGQVANYCYLENAIGNSTPPPAEEVVKLMNGLRVVYERLKSGDGCIGDMNTMGLMLNTGCVRGRQIGQPIVDAFEHAGAALVECEKRKDTHGRYGFTGPGILAMNAALDLYGELVAMSSRRQMTDCENEVCKWMRENAKQAA